jgi:hypothetical protein
MRWWSLRTFASIIVVALWSGECNAEPTLAEVLEELANPELTAARRTVISSNLSGIAAGLGWANTALRAQRMQRGLYCLPDNIEIQQQELIELLRDTLRDEPRLGQSPVGFGVLVALQRGFPCK